MKMPPTLNNEFRVVFQPKDKSIWNGRRRFGVGAYSLEKYVGSKNANTALLRALKSKEYKCTIKLRKFGLIDFYAK